jgi:hypothetical protein
MRTAAVTAILFAALSLFSNGVQAAPWCAHFNTGLNACSFYSFEQCMTAVWGVGGFCNPNPFSVYVARHPRTRHPRNH